MKTIIKLLAILTICISINSCDFSTEAQMPNYREMSKFATVGNYTVYEKYEHYHQVHVFVILDSTGRFMSMDAVKSN